MLQLNLKPVNDSVNSIPIKFLLKSDFSFFFKSDLALFRLGHTSDRLSGGIVQHSLYVQRTLATGGGTCDTWPGSVRQCLSVFKTVHTI